MDNTIFVQIRTLFVEKKTPLNTTLFSLYCWETAEKKKCGYLLNIFSAKMLFPWKSVVSMMTACPSFPLNGWGKCVDSANHIYLGSFFQLWQWLFDDCAVHLCSTFYGWHQGVYEWITCTGELCVPGNVLMTFLLSLMAENVWLPILLLL